MHGGCRIAHQDLLYLQLVAARSHRSIQHLGEQVGGQVLDSHVQAIGVHVADDVVA